MLGVTADSVFFIRRGNDNNANGAMDDCKSFRRYQMLRSIPTAYFSYVEEMITTQMMLWTIVNRSEGARC